MGKTPEASPEAQELISLLKHLKTDAFVCFAFIITTLDIINILSPHELFRHSLAFFCMAKQYFKHCALLLWLMYLWHVTHQMIMCLIFRHYVNSISIHIFLKKDTSLGILVVLTAAAWMPVYGWFYCLLGWLECFFSCCFLNNVITTFWHFEMFLSMWAECDATAGHTSLTAIREPS